MKTLSENRCFDGVQGVYSHRSASCKCHMTFGLFLPREAKQDRVPVLWYLSGLTCTHENAMTKAGAQHWAAEHGIAVIFPDTSPRGDAVPDDDDFALGKGAGFYVNATQDPWAANFQMWDYLTQDLPNLIFNEFSLDSDHQAITGHSMGGHGALTFAMAHPGRYRSVSAFAPICNPANSTWGQAQLSAYLGDTQADWARHDATQMMLDVGFGGQVLVDQGTRDPFLKNLRPEALAAAMAKRRQNGVFRMQPGYDHSYFFVSSFIEDHVAFHANALFER